MSSKLEAYRRRVLKYKFIRPMFRRNVWKILEGDYVEIIQGIDQGKQGIVKTVERDQRIPKVYVEGCNLKRRKIKRDVLSGNPGGYVNVERWIHYSNVMLVDPITKKPVRVVYKYTPDGEKVRVTKGKNASYSVIPTPPVFKDEVDRILGPKDTPAALARKQTYFPEQEYSYQQAQSFSTFARISNFDCQSTFNNARFVYYGSNLSRKQQLGFGVSPFWWRFKRYII
eukprot:TRINITY_DN3286_c0_g1_i20.p1 TRINITY_DN3286_c0_g1~~TRINITY_DN3286_c0_g1_i20.p1  ORF type:complete len:248 (+),score=15.76 TRINITY_DN3286_c0_g1_i20:64-744(+)